jgi:proteasome alpha subunit
MGGAADVVAGHLREHYSEGADLQAAVRLAVAALGHSEASDRVIPTRDLEVAVLDRTRQQPRKFARLRESRLVELLGERGPEQGDAPQEEDSAGATPPTVPAVDDPADPTDQVSGGTAPLEHPLSGEPAQPPVAPPVAPPVVPPATPPTPAPAPEPTDPAAPGEPRPPAPQPPTPDPGDPLP